MKKSNKIIGLFREYGDDLHRFVTRRFSDVADPEDVVQDAFQNLLKVDSLEDIENPRAYLYQSAQNLALNRIRKNRYHEAYLTEPHAEEDSRSPELIAQAENDLVAVENKLQNLPEKCRIAFVAHRVHGKSYQEIADELGVSVSSVEKYLMKAMKFLRESFDV